MQNRYKRLTDSISFININHLCRRAHTPSPKLVPAFSQPYKNGAQRSIAPTTNALHSVKS